MTAALQEVIADHEPWDLEPDDEAEDDAALSLAGFDLRTPGALRHERVPNGRGFVAT